MGGRVSVAWPHAQRSGSRAAIPWPRCGYSVDVAPGVLKRSVLDVDNLDPPVPREPRDVPTAARSGTTTRSTRSGTAAVSVSSWSRSAMTGAVEHPTRGDPQSELKTERASVSANDDQLEHRRRCSAANSLAPALTSSSRSNADSSASWWFLLLSTLSASVAVRARPGLYELVGPQLGPRIA